MIEDMNQQIFDSINEGDFLLAFFQTLLAVAAVVANVILYPISVIINAYLPELDAALSQISELFTYAGTYMAWIIDSLAIPSTVLVLVAAYWLFVFSVSFFTWSVKILLKFKKAILV